MSAKVIPFPAGGRDGAQKWEISALLQELVRMAEAGRFGPPARKPTPGKVVRLTGKPKPVTTL